MKSFKFFSREYLKFNLKKFPAFKNEKKTVAAFRLHLFK